MEAVKCVGEKKHKAASGAERTANIQYRVDKQNVSENTGWTERYLYWFETVNDSLLASCWRYNGRFYRTGIVSKCFQDICDTCLWTPSGLKWHGISVDCHVRLHWNHLFGHHSSSIASQHLHVGCSWQVASQFNCLEMTLDLIGWQIGFLYYTPFLKCSMRKNILSVYITLMNLGKLDIQWYRIIM